MSDLFDLAHVTQLYEIQKARLARNQPGIGREVKGLIRRLTSGGVAGKSDDIRHAQAKRLWDLGVGRELGLPSFEACLAGIPEIPAGLLQDDPEFPLLVLVETRIGLKKLCDLGGIAFDGNDDTFVAYDDRHREFTQPTWIRIQDGRKNRNRSVRDCRTSYGKSELGLSALQGVCSYLHHPQAVTEATQKDGHVMDLSGSVLRVVRARAAYLKLWYGQPKLHWRFDVSARPKFGSASRRECKAL
jgi:hypothetical protein